MVGMGGGHGRWAWVVGSAGTAWWARELTSMGTKRTTLPADSAWLPEKAMT